MTTINNLKEKLGNPIAFDLVKRKKDCFAQNTEGGITAISLSENSTLSELSLGKEAESLVYLSLSGIKSLKKVVFEHPLPRLTHLYLDNCSLTELVIPAGCKALKHIYLQKNQLINLVFQGEYSNLVVLDVSNNQLTDLLPLFPFFKNNVEIHYKDNPLSNPPAEIVERGKEAITNYLEQFIEQGEDYLFEAKTLILGKPRAGKTSLTLKIQNINNGLPEYQESTKGIDVHNWHFDLTAADIQPILVGKNVGQRQKMTQKALKDGFRVNLWDFGGQEIYTATHQFFLSRRSLYIIVDAEGKEDINWYDWFYQVEKLGDKSPLIVVINKILGRNWTIPNWGALKEMFDFVKDKHEINLETKTNEDKKAYYDLIKQLKINVLSLEHIGDPLPSFWTEIRQKIAIELDHKKNKKEQPFITESQFFDICQPFQEKDPRFGTEQQLMMSQYFHDIGIYLHFQDDDNLRNYIFLDANWTTKMVYMLLDDTIVRDTNKGHFNQKDIDRIWKNDKYRDIKGQLMHLLRHFGLAFTTNEQKKEFITPYHLSREKPSYQLSTTALPLLEMYYKFEQFMPKGILPQLTVTLSDYITDIHRVWYRGVVLEMPKYGTICEIEETYTNEIRIKVFGNERKETLAIIAKEVDKILKRFSKLKVEEMIPCNCELCKTNKAEATRSFYEHSKLKKRLASSKYYIECEYNNFKDVPIQPLLAEVFHGKEHFFDRDSLKNKDKMTELQRQVQDYVGKAQIDKAIDIIESWASTHGDSDARKAITMIKNKWSDLRNEQLEGTLDVATIDIRKATITKHILNFDWSKEVEKTIIPPIKPPSTMTGSNKNVIIGGVFALIALVLLLTTHRENGKISFLNGLFVIETGTSNPNETPKIPTKKVSVIGRISINGRQATEQDITEVFLKNDNSVNRDTPSGDGFTLKNVAIPADKRLDITVAFKDKTMASRVFNIPEPVEGKADIGELRITIEKPTPQKNGKVGSSKPTIVINNNFIVNNADSVPK